MRPTELFHLGRAYAQSLMAFHTNGVPRPFSASFAVTNKCNLRCVYCECPLMKTEELTFDEIKLLFSRLKEMGVVRLGVFGGEPLVRKDIGDILSLAKEMGFYLSLNSNLLLYERFKDKLDAVDYFFTSLDGTEEKHVQNRGKQDYNSIIAAIKDIAARGKKITVICVVTDPDYESADYLINLVDELGVDIHFQAECYDAEKAGRTAEEEMNQNETREFWKYIIKRKKEGSPISSSMGYLNYVCQWEDYRKTTLPDQSAKCAAGHGFLFVESTGYAYPCPYVKGQPIVKGIDLLKEEWKGFEYELPCTKCIVGPLREFNLLFNSPVKSSLEAVRRAF